MITLLLSFVSISNPILFIKWLLFLVIEGVISSDIPVLGLLGVELGLGVQVVLGIKPRVSPSIEHMLFIH